jgi:cell division FtsZ-interacting protein ZapD
VKNKGQIIEWLKERKQQSEKQRTDKLQEQVQYKNIDSLQTQLASVKLELEDYHNKLTESVANNKLLQEQIFVTT